MSHAVNKKAFSNGSKSVEDEKKCFTCKNYCKLSTHICKCWSFCEYPGERIIATYVLSHICKCWSFHLVKSWGNNYCNLSTHIYKCWSFCECQGERIITT